MTGSHHGEEPLPFEAAQLLARFLQQGITPGEMERLHALLDAATLERLRASFTDKPALQESDAFLRNLDTRAGWKQVRRRQRRKRRRVQAIAVAAVALLRAVAGLYRWSGTKHNETDRIVADGTYGHQNDVLPGSSRAELTL